MAFKRASSKEALHHRGRNSNYFVPVKSLLVIFVLVPLLFILSRVSNFKSTADQKKNLLREQLRTGDWRKLSTVEEIEDLFPKEVIDLIVANLYDSGQLNLNLVRRTDLSSSWVWERPVDQSVVKKKPIQRRKTGNDKQANLPRQIGISVEELKKNSKDVRLKSPEQGNASNNETLVIVLKGVGGGAKHKDVEANVLANHSQIENPAKIQRRQLRQRRREKRLTELIQQDEEEATNHENAAIMRSKVSVCKHCTI
jgi:alpha-1,4-galacturonosyltransferase